jgi:hypothetical protein
MKKLLSLLLLTLLLFSFGVSAAELAVWNESKGPAPQAAPAGVQLKSVIFIGAMGFGWIPAETSRDPREPVSPLNLRRPSGKAHHIGWPYKGVYTSVAVAFRNLTVHTCYQTVPAGHPGGFSFNASLNGWEGAWQMYERGLAQSVSPHVLVILPFHDCLHTYVGYVGDEWTCDLEWYMAVLEGIVNDAHARGLTVVMVGYPAERPEGWMMKRVYKIDPATVPRPADYERLRTLYADLASRVADAFVPGEVVEADSIDGISPGNNWTTTIVRDVLRKIECPDNSNCGRVHN